MDYLLPAFAVLPDAQTLLQRRLEMADQTKKDQTKDLPPKNVSKIDADKVKGGLDPVNGRPKPLEPINTGR